MSRIHVFTSAAGNYLPKVKVLFDSLAVHHPEWQRHLLLVEDWPQEQCEGVALDGELHQPRDLDIPDWRPWAFCHSMVELCTAVKPFMLKQLLAREDCDAVVYLDPDICVFSVLSDVVAALKNHAILLTPHQSTPEQTLSGVMANELTSLRHGTYNLGFIAVSTADDGKAFAQWWCQRAYRFNRDDVPNGLFTDQRWMDLVPGMFGGVGIMRQAHLNVASWNAHQRDLTWGAGGQVLAAGAPLGFYHFTGLDSGNHDAAMLYAGQPDGVQADLVQNYREALAESDRHYPYNAWSFGELDDGTAIDAAWRRAYRDDAVLQLRFPDPWRSSDLVGACEAAAGGISPRYISPGYAVRDDQAADLGRVGSHLMRSIKKPSAWIGLVKLASRIVGREGWRGLRRRMSRSGEERM
jgi:hypothetical protein